METDSGLAEFEYLWTSRKGDYVLVPTRHGFLPTHVNEGEVGDVLLVSDDRLARRVYEKMREAGCPIMSQEDVDRLG